MEDYLHKVLWTSGWDSTYRVLDLVLVQKLPLQAYYVKDSRRPSTALEISTMQKLRQMVIETDPTAEHRLLPLIISDRSELAPAQDITAARDALNSVSSLGDQYEWLARFAQQYQIDNLELSIHVDDKAFEHLRGNVEKLFGTYVLVQTPSRLELEIFRRFSFPILNLSKIDMAKKMQAAGLSPLMEQTWFCHTPDKKSRPCGRCGPCTYTIKEGLARRVPLNNRLKSGLTGFVKPARNLASSVCKKLEQIR